MTFHWLTMVLYVACNFCTGQQKCLESLNVMVTSLTHSGSYSVDVENMNRLKSIHSKRVSPIMHMTEETLLKHFRLVTSFKKNKYLLSDFPIDVPYAQYICSVYGGYLLEINDEDEHTAVKNMLRNQTFYGLHIGHNDHLKEGDYKFSFSGTNAFMKIAANENDGGRTQNCYALGRLYNYEMVDLYCYHISYFMCEIPDAK